MLLLDERGEVAESSTQSFCLVDSGVVYTAPVETVLRGVTRRVLMELAEDEDIEVREEAHPARAAGASRRGVHVRHHGQRLAGRAHR